MEVLAKVQKVYPGARLSEDMVPIEDRAYTVAGERKHATVTLHVPCRKCEACLKARSRLWRRRASAELAHSLLLGGRSWFGTLTLHPDEHHRCLAQARQRLDAQGISFESLTDEDQFRERCRPLAALATKWLKRVRKTSGARFRYLLVTEVHKSGLPHLHILVHESAPDAPVTERNLRETWPHGHSKFNLVREVGAALYLCKYLSKDARARVRASGRYGSYTV